MLENLALLMTFLPLCEWRPIKLQNCVHRLQLAIDVNRLCQHATYNKLVNCYKLKLDNATLQIFLVSQCAMSFVKKSSVLPHVEDYGLVVKSSKMVTRVYTCNLLSKIGNMICFIELCKRLYPELNIDFEPELFPCMTLKYCTITMRLFHTGKVVFLGVKDPCNLAKAFDFVFNLYFEYCLAHHFDNI